MKYITRKGAPSTVALLTVAHVKKFIKIVEEEGNVNALVISNDLSLSITSGILRYLAHSAPQSGLYGNNALERTEVDHWLQFSTTRLACASEFEAALAYLDKVLGPITFLVGHSVTLADITIWSALRGSCLWQGLLMQGGTPMNVKRYYNFLSAQEHFKNVDQDVPTEKPIQPIVKPKEVKNERKEEGKFIELPGAEMGKVVVRFPPEASGYLHVGHAKAALLNQYYQEAFKGKLIMRFDDTNPAKENAEFEKVILEDIEKLGIKPDMFTHTSDHFDRILEFCEQMLKEGKAYVDDTDPDTMKKEREERTDSKCRGNTVAKNLEMWNEMKNGTQHGQKCAVRAKIDMKSDNGCMRDPTIYRCKNEEHVRTGNKYKVYPTYDFACPIVDSIEGVTHSLRTTEYLDRDDQFYWFCDALNLRKPHIWAYSRLNMQNTVMSKRKLTWFVDEKLVDSWDDPRFPTVRGVLRRGMTVEALKQFVIAQGSSRSINMMEWDKIWAVNKKVIDPIVPRYTALSREEVVPVMVSGVQENVQDVQAHPKDPNVGMKKVYYSPRVLIEGADALTLSVGENVTFINWGNLKIKKINKKSDGSIESVEADPNLENKDYKKTQKLTWLADTNQAPFTATKLIHYDHIISKAVLAKEDDFKQFINYNSKQEYDVLGDPELTKLKKGDIIQLQRRGYYICDAAYEPISRYSSRESPCILINIPDGHTKEMPTTGSKHKDSSSAKEKAQSKKGKSAEKSPQGDKIPDQPFSADAAALNQKIVDQGNLVRKLKSEKAPKDKVGAEVKVLLTLKTDFKNITGEEWKPGMAVPATPAQQQLTAAAVGGDASLNSPEVVELNTKITEQGNKIRELKAGKAAKDKVGAEVNVLLALKTDFKNITGQEWKPGMATPAASVQQQQTAAGGAASLDSPEVVELNTKITEQGNKIRELKAGGASKDQVGEEVKVLLAFKADYKKITGKDWKPGGSTGTVKKQTEKPQKAASSRDMTSPDSPEAQELKAKIDAQGNKVRELKTGGADKDEVDSNVKTLLDLKAQYKDLTGQDLGGGGKKDKKGANKENKGGKGQQAKKEEKPAKTEDETGGREVKKQTRLGLEAKKEENLPDWYSQVITKAEMIEYYDVSGCYVLRPWSYGIWEMISKWFDAKIKEIGFQNCYFPIFVSNGALQKEKEHVEDFAPEVAWVTRSGDTQLAEPIAIRPTSETVMYPAYSKWVQSHRDLPIKLNQWCNVVRWEFKHPQPFLRTREFLWQEGHSAYATYDEAVEEVHHIIDLYEEIYETILAIPVVKGKKTQKEKFAGADFTTTVEAYISATGRGIQASTSHHLGQNFSKMFDISFEDPETKERRYAYQNSWAITTRSIGVIIMVHGDNKGLVLPPRIAVVQVVVVPCGITANLGEAERKELMSKCDEFVKSLKAAGIRAEGDYRDNYSPGWKFNHWELKGVPIRVEIGPRDLAQKQFVTVVRMNGEKSTLLMDGAPEQLQQMLDKIHDDMFNKAKHDLDTHKALCYSFEDFCSNLDQKKLVLAPFCGDIPCEEKIKKISARDAVVEEGAPAMGAKGLCIPFIQPAEITDSMKCVCPDCPNKPKNFTLFGRSY